MLSVFKTEAHTKSTAHKYQGNTLGDFHGKAAATRTMKIVAPMHKVHFAFAKMTSHCHTFAILMPL